MTTILLAGVAVADFVFVMDEMPRQPEKYRANDAYISGGGNAANSAVAVARLGASAELAARLGNDQVAELILRDLQAEGVGTQLCDIAEGGKSSFSSIYIDGRGERQIMNFRGSGLREDCGWFHEFDAFDAALVDNRFPPLTKAAIELANRQGKPSVVDAEAPCDLESICDATHVAFSLQGARDFTGEREIGAQLSAARKRLSNWVFITDGENGVVYEGPRGAGHVPAFGVDVVDTLGAGDTWHAAFAVAIAEGQDEVAAIRFANAAAAIKCTRKGGRNGAPTRAEVDGFLQENR